MMNEQTNEAAELVTLSSLVAEPGLIYGDSVEALARRLGDEVIEDDIGRRCVTRDTARRLVAERREREAGLAEDARRRREKLERKPHAVPVGVPAQEGMSAFESLAASDDYQTVQDEFGLPRPTFLEDALAEGQRAAREKQRLADRMKDELGRGKP